MAQKVKPLNFISKQYREDVLISVLEIDDLNADLIEILDKYFISICEGDSESELANVKLRVQELFMKKDETWIMGGIAEFFIHLYMNLNNFKQECLYKNLEENSIKKGFDGFYSKDDLFWIMESKSGSIKTKNISHSRKVKEAFQDLKGKFCGNCSNDPWNNAYNHACHCDVGTSKDLRKTIKKLSEEFTRKEYHLIKDFNIVPCGTIFLQNNIMPKNSSEITEEVIKIVDNLEFKQIHIICVTQKTVDIFKQYINS